MNSASGDMFCARVHYTRLLHAPCTWHHLRDARSN